MAITIAPTRNPRTSQPDRAVRTGNRLIPRVENLEGRELLASFLVTSAADSGPGTLRGVLSQANGNGEANVIRFQENLGEINLTSGPLTIQNDLTIVGPASGITIGRSLASGTPSFRIMELTAARVGNTFRRIAVHLENLTITRGQAFDDVGGGGILNAGQALTMVGCTLSRNSSRTVGGGLFDRSTASTVTIQECTFVQNAAQRSGGGIYSLGGLTVSGSSFIGNTGPVGGGLYKQDINARFENCTFQGNRAIQSGGAMFLNGPAQTFQVVACTIAENLFGGGIAGTGTLVNTIVASNDGGDLKGAFFGESNLIGDGSGGLNPSLNLLSLDPKLGPLEDNGGPTLTMTLLPGSPARNTARPIGQRFDQRMFRRPALGGYDLGAVEVGGIDQPSLVVNTTDDVVDYGDGLTSIREAVDLANTAFRTATITFDPVVFQTHRTITLNPFFGALSLLDGRSILGPQAGVTLARSQAPGTPRFPIIAITSEFRVERQFTVQLERLTLTGGAGSYGGGIQSEIVQLNVFDCAIVGNSALLGGGIFARFNLSVRNSAIINNKAIEGGGIDCGRNLFGFNCTIVGNTADFRGGGLSTLFLSMGSSTIVDNSAQTGGGLAASGFFDVEIHGSIIAKNAGGNILGVQFRGTNNLVGDNSAPQITSPGFSNVSDPRLGPLQNNGGLTPTMALLPGSPALSIIPSSARLTDQRGPGFDRVVGGRADLGAYEAGNPAAIVVKVTVEDPPRTYGAGEILRLRVEFTQDVVVTGEPRLELNSGGTAVFKSMASKQVLIFEYHVRPGEFAPRLDTLALRLAGGSIRDTKGVDVDPTLPESGVSGSLAANAGIAIDTAPAVRSYRILYGSRSFDLIGSAARVLPWRVTGIQAVFSEPIATASAASLAGITATGFFGLGTNTLTWTFDPVSSGIFATALLGVGPDALRDTTGTALAQGEGFARTFRVLHGDTNGDGVVSSADMSATFSATLAPYNPFADLNSDGVVDMADVRIARSRIGARL